MNKRLALIISALAVTLIAPAQMGDRLPDSIANVVLVEGAQAHGPHHSPIRPAYDCFKYWNTETKRWHSTEGDYYITVDLDLDVYILYRCVCTWSVAYQKYFCHWREIARAKEIADLPKPENNKPGDQFKVRKHVYEWARWTAWHASTGGCVVHSGRRWMWEIERHGSEGAS